VLPIGVKEGGCPDANVSRSQDLLRSYLALPAEGYRCAGGSPV
jgi:hypothetical protein